jgi:hypothetical protein
VYKYLNKKSLGFVLGQKNKLKALKEHLKLSKRVCSFDFNIVDPQLK